ncbi:sigma-70 family RNA polymerase sigma factor [Rubritalea halochordaticola]
MDRPDTRHSLIMRACDVGDADAWQELVQQYQRFIYYVLGEIGIDHADLDDVSQQVLVHLTRDLASYDKNKGSFRGWLSAVIRNTALSHLRKSKRRSIRLQKFGQELQIDEADAMAPELDALIEEEWTTYIANLAMEKVRATFQGQAVKVFELGLDGLSAEQIAEQTDLTVQSVYTLRKRVKKRLYLEIRALTADLEP